MQSLCKKIRTSECHTAGRMKNATEELKANDGKDDDGKENEKCNLKQRSHRLQNRLQDNLKT